MITIIIDDRERDSGVIECLNQQSQEIRIKTERQKTGDYRIISGAALSDSVLIERKTVDDFCISLIDGRLFRQAYLLLAGSDHPLMIVEGSWKDRAVAVEYPAIQGALLTLAQAFHLPLVYTRDPRDTAAALILLARQKLNRCKENRLRPGRTPKRLVRQKLHVLQALPGVGKQLAQAMLEHFGSVRAVFAATQKELQTMEGIGAKRAARIIEVIATSIQPGKNSPKHTVQRPKYSCKTEKSKK